MTDHKLINQDSGDFEYYTPQPIIEAAILTMGRIDLDPASSETANYRIKAIRFYSIENDGLSLPWIGRIWMNHPFSRTGNPLWINKLVSEFENGNIISSCNITYASTSEQWFQPLLKHPQCFLSPRTNYLLPNGTLKRGVTKGSVVTYLGPDPQRFKKYFNHLGICK